MSESIMEKYADNLWRYWYENYSAEYSKRDYDDEFYLWAVHKLSPEDLGELSNLFYAFKEDEEDEYFQAREELREYIDKEYITPFDPDNMD